MDFVTKTEAATYFKVHPRTIERWLLNGDLKGYKLGKGRSSVWRIRKSDITQMLSASANKKNDGTK